jgi:hypothetical protein
LVGLGDGGSICVRTVSGSSHLVVDVAGWFGPGSGGLAYRATAPERLLDTREDAGHVAASERVVHVDGVAVLNVVGVDSTSPGYVTVRPCGSTAISSLVNTAPLEATANVTAVDGDGAGNVCARSNVPAHLVVDRVGSFVP